MGGSGFARNETRCRRGASAASAPARFRASKLHGRPATSAPDSKFRGSNGWRGCATTMSSRARPLSPRTVWSMTSSSSPTGTAGGRCQVGALVTTRIGEDEVVAGGQEGVEQQLAILAAHVAITDPRREGRQVVAVALDVAREAPVVQPEQAHDPVGNRPHRHQRADREVPGAEVRPGRPALEAFGHHGTHVVTGEVHRTHDLVDGGLAHQLVEERASAGPAATHREARWRSASPRCGPGCRPSS